MKGSPQMTKVCPFFYKEIFFSTAVINPGPRIHSKSITGVNVPKLFGDIPKLFKYIPKPFKDVIKLRDIP